MKRLLYIVYIYILNLDESDSEEQDCPKKKDLKKRPTGSSEIVRFPKTNEDNFVERTVSVPLPDSSVKVIHFSLQFFHK